MVLTNHFVYVYFDNAFSFDGLLCMIHLSSSIIIALVYGDDGFGFDSLLFVTIMVDKIFCLIEWYTVCGLMNYHIVVIKWIFVK